MTLARTTAVALVVAVTLAGVAPGVATAQQQPAWAETLFADLQSMSETYNANVADARADMSGPTRTVYNQLNGRTVNVYVHGTDVTYSFQMTQSGRITDLQQGSRGDAQVAMYMTRDTAERLTGSAEPVGRFVTAVQNGRFVGSGDDRTVRGVVIRGESGNVVEQVKWTGINLAKGFLF
jgi:hypothetical protein